jgi:hypothetical protein
MPEGYRSVGGRVKIGKKEELWDRVPLLPARLLMLNSERN